MSLSQESETPRTASQQPAPNSQPLLLDGLGTATHQQPAPNRQPLLLDGVGTATQKQTHSSSSRIPAFWSTASSTQSILKAPFTSKYCPPSRISLASYLTKKYLHKLPWAQDKTLPESLPVHLCRASGCSHGTALTLKRPAPIVTTRLSSFADAPFIYRLGI